MLKLAEYSCYLFKVMQKLFIKIYYLDLGIFFITKIINFSAVYCQKL